MYQPINEMAFILDGDVWYRYAGDIFTESGNKLGQTAKKIIEDNIYVEKCKSIGKRSAKSVERDFEKFIKQKLQL